MNIQGFETYKVTKDGNIFKGSKKLKKYINRNGYEVVYLYKDNKRYFKQVHRLVAQSFIENIECKPQVNHKNGIRADNRVENLEWTTASENCRHSITVLNRKVNKGENHGMSKLKEYDIHEIFRLHNEGYSYTQISIIFSVTPELIGMVLNRQLWKHVEGCKKIDKYVCQFDNEKLLLNRFVSQGEAARVLGFNQSLINRALQGKCKKAYGFIWEYSYY